MAKDKKASDEGGDRRTTTEGEGPAPAQTETQAQTEAETERGAKAEAPPAEPPHLPLFYRKPRPLHLTEDADLALKGKRDYSFAAHATALPLVLSEFPAAARDFPILFSPADPPLPVVLTGLFKEQSLFVGSDGAWRAGTYLPAYVRRYPFLLGGAMEGGRRLLLIDEEAPVVTRGEGVALIEDGGPSQVAGRALKLCEAFARDQRATHEFVEALMKYDLLEARKFTLTLRDGQKMAVTDVRVVNREKFDALPDDAFLEGRRHNWLFPVFCHFVSLQNLQALANRAIVPRPVGDTPGETAPKAEAKAASEPAGEPI